MPATTDWRASLPLLEGHGLVLLPVGASSSRKAPADPLTGNGLSGWQQHPGFSAADIAQASPHHVIACGINCGPSDVLVLDIDGRSAAEWLQARGADPYGVNTWSITRDTSTDRFKLVFRLTPEQQLQFPQTKLLLRTTKGEALEIYWQRGAHVVVLGEHPSSGGQYQWGGTGGPWAIAAPDALWMDCFAAIREAVQELRGKGDTSRPPRVQGVASGAGWRAYGAHCPCPICGRNHSAACTGVTASDGRNIVTCFHGGTFSPPLGLKKGEVITGVDGRKWGFVREYEATGVGDKSEFIEHQPSTRQRTRHVQQMQQPKPAASSTERPTAPDVPAVDAFRRDIKAVIEQSLSGSALIAYSTQKAVEYDISPSQAAEIRKELQQEYEVGLQAEQQGAALTADADREQFRKQHLTLDRLFGSGPLVDAIRIVTRGLNTDDFASACTFLTTVASVMPLGSTVRGNWDTFVVPTNTYMAIVGDSGTGKTQILKALAEMPLSALHQTATNNYNRALEQWREDNNGVKPADRSPQPDFIYVYVNGYTAEAADEQLAIQESHGKPLLIYNDELSRVFESLDCYTSKGRRGIGEAQLLRMFDGSGNVEIRMKGGRRYRQCLISILGGLQNDVFAKMAKDGDPYGTFARIMLCQMPVHDDSIDIPYVEPDQQTSRTVVSEHYLQDFLASIYSELPRQVVLSPEAMRVFHRIISVSKNLANSAEIKPHKAIYGKRAGYVLRWAGLLHIIRTQHDGRNQPICVETLNLALDCVDQLQSYALRAHSCLASQGENAVHNIGERILKAASLRPNGITAGEFYRNNLSAKERRAYSSDAITAFFTQLVNGGHASLDSSGKVPRLLFSLS